jgi:primary-amine oxidase
VLIPTATVVRIAWEPLTKSYPWDKPQVTERNTMHVVEYPVDEETWLDWPRNSGEFYVVYSADKTNGMSPSSPQALFEQPY